MVEKQGFEPLVRSHVHRFQAWCLSHRINYINLLFPTKKQELLANLGNLISPPNSQWKDSRWLSLGLTASRLLLGYGSSSTHTSTMGVADSTGGAQPDLRLSELWAHLRGSSQTWAVDKGQARGPAPRGRGGTSGYGWVIAAWTTDTGRGAYAWWMRSQFMFHSQNY